MRETKNMHARSHENGKRPVYNNAPSMIGAWELKNDMCSALTREGAEKPTKALVADEQDVVATDQQGDVVTCELAHEQRTIGYGTCNDIGEEREEK